MKETLCVIIFLDEAFLLVQVISLGDKIKFSLSPSKSTDRLSTNVPGVPLDDRNLVCGEPFSSLPFIFCHDELCSHFSSFQSADNKGSQSF